MHNTQVMHRLSTGGVYNKSLYYNTLCQFLTIHTGCSQIHNSQLCPCVNSVVFGGYLSTSIHACPQWKGSCYGFSTAKKTYAQFLHGLSPGFPSIIHRLCPGRQQTWITVWIASGKATRKASSAVPGQICPVDTWKPLFIYRKPWARRLPVGRASAGR